MTAHDDEQRALDEAAAWLTRIRAGGLGGAEQARFRAWLDDRAENAAAMDLVSRAWAVSGRISDRGNLRPDLSRARSLRLADGARSPRRPRRLAAPLGGLAAAVAVLALVFLWNDAVIEGDYAAAPGDMPVVQLADGTVIHLDGGTRLHVRIDPFGRRVDLRQGEAEFQVAHESLRPFQVVALDLAIHDLGTRFIVRQRGDTVRMVLLEGAADIRDAASGKVLTVLAPGQQVEQTGQGALHQGRANTAQVQAWRDRRAVFDDTPLSDALPELEQRTGAVLRLADPALGGLRVSGVYQVGDIPGFLNSLSRVHPLVWHRTAAGEYQIERRPR